MQLLSVFCKMEVLARVSVPAPSASNEGSPPHHVACRSAATQVRLASVRRSLFTNEAERSKFLNHLANGTRDILRNQQVRRRTLACANCVRMYVQWTQGLKPRKPVVVSCRAWRSTPTTTSSVGCWGG